MILRDTAALILKICMKKLQHFFKTVAPMHVLALLFSLNSANKLLEVEIFTKNTIL